MDGRLNQTLRTKDFVNYLRKSVLHWFEKKVFWAFLRVNVWECHWRCHGSGRIAIRQFREMGVHPEVVDALALIQHEVHPEEETRKRKGGEE